MGGHRIFTRCLPVEFGESLRELRSAVRELQPAVVLCVGLAGGRTEVSIERAAINVDDARIPDNAGASPVDMPVVEDGPAAYFSTLPIKSILLALWSAGIPAAVSQTAGTYVCNHVFYGLMHALRRKPKVRAGFIHVPASPDIARPGEPSLEVEDIARALEHFELRRIADELEADRPKIVDVAASETGLPDGRIGSELTRTTSQLAMFAELIESPEWLDARVDLGDPARQPSPKPEVRSMRRGLGPVAVFGASNFPLAFSVAGGDTASALAAGCPVIAKAHPSHPGTSAVAAAAIVRAAEATGMPDGVFAVVFDDGIEVGEALVRHPGIKAVGFTGSRGGGEALTRLATQPLLVCHLLDIIRDLEDVALLILGQRVVAVLRDVDEGVQADKVCGAEHGRLRATHGLAEDDVNISHAQAVLLHGVHDGHHAVDADAVGHEVGRVLGEHDPLAQHILPKARRGLHDLRIRLLAGDDLQQLHVAHRVEEVHHDEALLEAVAASLHHVLDGQARGVRRDDGVGVRVLLDLVEGGLLDLERLGHRLNDEVAVSQQLQVILDVARRQQLQIALAEDRGGLLFLHRLDGARREAGAGGRVFDVVFGAGVGRDDVQQHAGDASVGKVRRDATAHDAAADHGSFADSSGRHRVSPLFVDEWKASETG